MNNMLGYMTICYKPTLHGCVTSKKAESAPADPVGGLAAWQNSASCDGCRTTSTLPLRPARTVYAPGLRLSLENS